MVAAIDNHNITISSKARPGFSAPKNNHDHKVFKTSCHTNRAKGTFAASRPPTFFHTSQAAIPIKRYSTVQTGPNTAFGGCHEGLSSAVYQLSCPVSVTIEPRKAAAKQSPTQNNSPNH